MSIHAMDALSITRQSEMIFDGVTMGTNPDENDEAGASLVDVLPVEIIRAICEHLPVKDVANFRLTSNVCAAAGMDRLVQDIYVIFTRESFEKLLNISKHPEMSKHVITIRYEPLLLETLDEDEYRDMLEYGITPLSQLDSSPKSQFLFQMSRAFILYNKIWEDQNLMKKSEFSRWVFSQVLPKFSSLKSFIMEGCVLGQNQRLSRDLEPLTFLDQLQSIDRECHEEILAFFSAAGKADTKLEYLHLGQIDLNMLHRASTSTGIIFPDGPDARYIRYLYLGVWISPSYNCYRGLRQLLQATSNLEHLTIANEIAFGYMDWDEVVPGLTLPYLRILEFSCVKGSSTSLAKFLQRHSKTLKSFQIWRCILKGDLKDWAEVFDTIKDDLTLKEVYFSPMEGREPNIPTDFEDGNNFIKLTHTYHGHRFESLLKDRLLRKDLLAKECSLVPSVLWQGYLAFSRTERQKAKARFEEIESQGLTWDMNNDEDMRLCQFFGH
ncbi:hypothetical protein EAF04_002937 [Stromatinia cepivora]|nr:hypothetical protein EAF04_002937 [Stromatinia cepivora]